MAQHRREDTYRNRDDWNDERRRGRRDEGAFRSRDDDRSRYWDYGRGRDRDFGQGYGRGGEQRVAGGRSVESGRDDRPWSGSARRGGFGEPERGGDFGSPRRRAEDRNKDYGYGRHGFDYGRDTGPPSADWDYGAYGNDPEYSQARSPGSTGFGYGGRDRDSSGYGGYSERWSADRQGFGYGDRKERHRGGRDDRGLFERAADEVSSWFGGDDDADRRYEHRGRGPKNYRRSDDRIREDVSDRLTDDWAVDASDIEVAVSSGEVTLSGTVSSRDQRRRAEDLAERVSGVTHVQNNMRVRDRRGTVESAGSGETSLTGVQGSTGGPDLGTTTGSRAGSTGSTGAGRTDGER